MSAITPNEFSRNMTIVWRDGLWTVLEYARSRTGQRKPVVVTKLRNLYTGQVLQESFSSDEKLDTAFIETKTMQFLYRQGDAYVLMDMESFEQPEVPSERMSGVADLLKEGCDVVLRMYGQEIIDVAMPDFIELAVTEAPPYVKGDTAGSEYVPVTLETGATIKVPPFVKEGDVLQIDTRTREYVKRVE